MVKIYDVQTGAEMGELTEEQLQFLQDHLEEESEEDKDYYFNQDTLDMLAGAGAGDDLLVILRRAMGNREEAELRWSRH
jgi:hypothetical protein